MLLQRRRRSRRRAVTRVSLRAVLREIVYILGFIRFPCARFPVVTHVAVTAMAKKCIAMKPAATASHIQLF